MTPRIFVSDIAGQAEFLRSVFGATGEVERGISQIADVLENSARTDWFEQRVGR